MNDSYTTNLEISDSTTDSMFYVVSAKKFTILFLATLGTYGMYWFYKNWSLYRARSKENIWPIPRSIFSIFFIHSLFQHINKQIVSTQTSIKFDPRSSANQLIMLIIVSNLLDRMAMRSVGSPTTDILSIVMLVPLLGQFLKAQAAINLACDDNVGSRNNLLTTANYIWIVIGAVLWVLTIIGLVAG